MIENENKLKELLEVLEKEGILYDIVLIGSWALLFYKQIFDDFEPLIRTTDIDFYVPNTKAIKETNNTIETLKEINYDIIVDLLTKKSTFISPDGFEIEFLTKLNRGSLTCVKLGNTGIYAESLPYVDIFSNNYIDVTFGGLILKVASPSSYVLQKLLISKARKNKQAKDIESVKHVLKYIKTSKKSVNELASLFSSLPLKWQKRILSVAKENGINVLE